MNKNTAPEVKLVPTVTEINTTQASRMEKLFVTVTNENGLLIEQRSATQDDLVKFLNASGMMVPPTGLELEFKQVITDRDMLVAQNAALKVELTKLKIRLDNVSYASKQQARMIHVHQTLEDTLSDALDNALGEIMRISEGE